MWNNKVFNRKMLLLTSCNFPSLMEIHLSSPQAYKMQPVSKNFSKSDKVRPTLPCSLQARQDEDSVSKLSDCDKQPKIFLQTFWHSPEGSRATSTHNRQHTSTQSACLHVHRLQGNIFIDGQILATRPERPKGGQSVVPLLQQDKVSLI